MTSNKEIQENILEGDLPLLDILSQRVRSYVQMCEPDYYRHVMDIDILDIKLISGEDYINFAYKSKKYRIKVTINTKYGYPRETGSWYKKYEYNIVGKEEPQMYPIDFYSELFPWVVRLNRNRKLGEIGIE